MRQGLVQLVLAREQVGILEGGGMLRQTNFTGEARERKFWRENLLLLLKGVERERLEGKALSHRCPTEAEQGLSYRGLGRSA